ncbi:MAG: amino acid adenylation domain-containing protein [Nostoc sp.]
MNKQQLLTTNNLIYPNQSFIEFAKIEIEQSIASRFAQQVSKYNQRLAIQTNKYKWSYDKLNKIANRIAHKILKSCGKEQRIALLFEHDAPMIAATLGVLKLGKTYIPLDFTFPKERLSYMLLDSEVGAILTNSFNMEFAKTIAPDNLPIINFDDIISSDEVSDDIHRGVLPDEVAYILYTSGSTGKPKGVMQSHRNVLHHIRIWTNSLCINANDRLTLLSSYGWDSAVQDTFGALLNGASVHPMDVKNEGLENLSQWLMDREITIYHSTLPLYRQFARNLTREESLSKLRLLILGGDLINRRDIELYKEHFSDETIVVNAYGSTESTTCLQYFVNKQTEITHNVIPAGYAVNDTEVLLLDEEGKQVEAGNTGEIAVKSAHVALGYWKQPEMTATKFQSDPNGGDRRIYRMGDLGYIKSDGSIAIAGRKDFQVKIRGFRIELGEIEATLNQHPNVQEAVVTVREDTADDKRLIAYVVPNQKQVPTISELRSFLQERLPDYFMPSHFMMLKALPLTPNHKIDRKALPAPDIARPELEKEFVAPRTPVENIMARIWTEVLNLERVGIHDNFLDLGGDSLLGFQIIARVRQAGLSMTIRQLRKYPTIAELALLLDKTSTNQVAQGTVTGLVQLTPIKHWVLEQNFADFHSWSQGVLLEVRQALDLALLEKALEQLLVHHDALRIRFSQGDSGWQQIVAEPDKVTPSIEIVDLSKLSETEQKYAQEQTINALTANLNLIKGPLLKFAFLNLGSCQPSRLLLVIHQALIDGVSWRILLEDLQTAYEQLRRGEIIKLAPKTTSLKEWAEQLQKYAKSAAIQPELDYWQAVASTQVNRLPIVTSRNANALTLTRDIATLFSIEETRILLQDVPKVYKTRINEVLLTAFVQSISQWTGDRLLRVDLKGHGREAIMENADISRTVGWFTTIAPILIDIRKTNSLEETLLLVKEQLQRIPNQGIGYGLLRFLHGDVDIAQKMTAMQAEVSFNYLGQFDQILPASSLFGIAEESVKIVRGRPSHPLEVTGAIVGGRLHFDWTFSVEVYQQSLVEQLAQNFSEAIQAIITRSQSVINVSSTSLI